MLPKFIINIINDFKIENVLSWLKELATFYILPIHFFKSLFRKDYKLQVYQIVFYTALAICLNIVLWKTELVDNYKTIFSLILLGIPFIITNVLSVLIVGRSKSHLWTIFSFVYLVWLLLSIPSFVLLNLFVSTENYSFYFLSNLLMVLAFLFALFLIWHVLFNSLRKIVGGYVLNLLFLNLSYVIFSLIFFDSYSKTSSNDPIINELTEHLNEVKNFQGVPYTFVEESNPKLSYRNYKLSLINNDTLLYYNKNNTDFYRERSKENSLYLDSLNKIVKFNRNKEILSELSKFYKNISTYFKYPPCDTCLVKHVVYRSKTDSSIVLDRKEFIIDEPYIRPYRNFERKMEELSELNDFATSPCLAIGFLMRPIRYIVSLLGLKEVQVNMNFSL
ncbi:MAG: hypothetical protein A2546_00100 [Sphingobacteriia bacterium RIFOXYD2_FULL_35_12]|nr:MAG: hypothetical protein A2472_12095 [Sphingobacteriia bacterium RIFOXYC2_FULL_35_18]OHC89200.1 MAG: hypothetical protein A2546_00100 [Sphingobacteriia bacterium RIFOXYD2_FULL_35_12]